VSERGNRWRQLDESGRGGTIHRCPKPGSGLTPCCRKAPGELPVTDRLTTEDILVTCRGRGRG
jgi:hypothetical protein